MQPSNRQRKHGVYPDSQTEGQLEGRLSQTVIEIDPMETVEQVKKRLQEKHGFPVEQQRLIFGGKQLDDTKTVMECQIAQDSTLHLVLRTGVASTLPGQQPAPETH